MQVGLLLDLIVKNPTGSGCVGEVGCGWGRALPNLIQEADLGWKGIDRVESGSNANQVGSSWRGGRGLV